MAYESRRPPTSPYTGNGRGNRNGFESEARDMAGAPLGPPSADNGGRSAGDLLRQLIGDVTVLIRKELALAASEIGHSVDEAKRGATSMITGGAVLYAGVLFLLAGLTLWLGTMMATWTAALIVGAVVAVIGFVMVQAGKKHVQAQKLVPERTMESLRKDKQAIQREVA